MSVREIKNGQKKKIAGLVTPQTASKDNYGIVKLSDSENIFDSNAGFALSTSEKNARVSGSLAQQIGSNRADIDNLQTSVSDKMNLTLIKSTAIGITDFDDLTQGSYRVSGMVSNYPENTTRGKNGILESYSLNPTYAVQFFRSFDGTLVTSRVKWDGKWSPWTELAKKEDVTPQEWAYSTNDDVVAAHENTHVFKIGKIVTMNISGYIKACSGGTTLFTGLPNSTVLGTGILCTNSHRTAKLFITPDGRIEADGNIAYDDWYNGIITYVTP